MKKNLMLSGFTLLCTLFLLICIITAWYVTNKEASATGITGSTDGDSYSLKLQRGLYDDEDDEWTWIDTNHLAFSNVSPGNTFYFRIALELDNNNDLNLRASFDNIVSSLMPGKLTVSNNYVSTVEGNVPLYKINEDDECIVNNKVLYQIIDGQDSEGNLIQEIYLSEYKIEDTFLFYNLGTIEPETNDITVLDDLISEDDIKVLSEVSNFNLTRSEEGITYFYFALEFNEELTMVDIYGDGMESSNCYLYQKLSIGYISISKI